MSDTLPPDASLSEARDWLQRTIVVEERGVYCPCCDQLAKIYKRTINAAMVSALVTLFVATRDGSFVHWPSRLRAASQRGGDNTKLVYWKLVEAEPLSVRPDGGRSGYWRITSEGWAFLRGHHRVPKYALVYNGHLLQLTGELVSVNDCYDKPFDLAELMG